MNEMEMAEYKKRNLRQVEHWVNGASFHNYIDNECCPDFSCCHPDLFTRDVNERAKIYQNKLNNVQTKQ